MKIRDYARAIAVTCTLVLGIVGAGNAFAESGVALVVERNDAQRTLTLDSGRLLHVTAATALENEQGEPVAFADVPFARSYRGRYAITGAERVHYEASDATGSWIASRIVLQPVAGH